MRRERSVQFLLIVVCLVAAAPSAWGEDGTKLDPNGSPAVSSTYLGQPVSFFSVSVFFNRSMSSRK